MLELQNQFNALVARLSTIPYEDQERLCADFQFYLNDYEKRFPPYAMNVYGRVFGALRDHIGFSATDKTILEIGPGFSVGVLFCAAISGARRVVAVDAFPHDKGADSDYIASMFNHCFKDRSFFLTDAQNMNDDDFTNAFAACIAKDAAGRFCYRPERLSFDFPYSVEKLPYADNSFDCVYSFATFEHFREPGAAVAELYRVTKPGGINYHSVDLRDHRNFNAPLEFLTVPKNAWNEFGKSITNYSFTNRLRDSEIVRCFGSHGFAARTALPFQRCSISAELRIRLDADYAKFSDEELGILGSAYIFQKQETL